MASPITDPQTGDPRKSGGIPKWLRIVLPAVLILVWLSIGGIGGPYFGKISQVSSNDATSYLPASSDATRVQNLEVKFADRKVLPAVVLYVRGDGLTVADRNYITGRIAAIASARGISRGVSPAIASKDGKAVEIVVPVKDNTALDTSVSNLRAVIAHGSPRGLTGYVTGPAGQIADLGGAFAGIDGVSAPRRGAGRLRHPDHRLSVAAAAGPGSPDVDLRALRGHLRHLAPCQGWCGGAQRAGAGILFILVIGAATDYSLLYVSRYREALRDHQKRWDATVAAFRGAFAPILASAGTVILGLLCLLLSDLNSNKALGPVGAIGIAFALLAALTMLPALLLAFGRAAFWPLRPRFGSPHPLLAADAVKGLWPRLGRGISKRPRWVWVTCAVLLLAASAGLLQLKASGNAAERGRRGLLPGARRPGRARSALSAGFGKPGRHRRRPAALAAAATRALDTSGVDSVTVLSTDSPSGSYPVTRDGIQPLIPGVPAGAPTVVNGKVLLQATLGREIRIQMPPKRSSHTCEPVLRRPAVPSSAAPPRPRSIRMRQPCTTAT